MHQLCRLNSYALLWSWCATFGRWCGCTVECIEFKTRLSHSCKKIVLWTWRVQRLAPRLFWVIFFESQLLNQFSQRRCVQICECACIAYNICAFMCACVRACKVLFNFQEFLKVMSWNRRLTEIGKGNLVNRTMPLSSMHLCICVYLEASLAAEADNRLLVAVQLLFCLPVKFHSRLQFKEFHFNDRPMIWAPINSILRGKQSNSVNEMCIPTCAMPCCALNAGNVYVVCAQVHTS